MRSIPSNLGCLLALGWLVACNGPSPEAPSAAEPQAEPPPTAEPATAPTQPASTAVAPTATAEEPAAALPKAAEASAAEAVQAEGTAPEATANAQPAPNAENAAAAAPAAKPEAGTYAVTGGSASFLIDAPLEKIKGTWSKVGGSLQIDPGDLKKTRGAVTADVRSLKTHTFGIPDKDARQTEHALNWMEVGSEVDAATRARNATARFTIERVEKVTPSALTDGALTAKATVRGTLMLHGKASKHTVDVEVGFEGPANAPTAVTVKTAAPLVVSLEHHDVKPRDLAGRFLAGALEKIGEKITDSTRVTLDLRASRK